MNLSEYRGKKRPTSLSLLCTALHYLNAWNRLTFILTFYYIVGNSLWEAETAKKLHFVLVQERTMGRPQILIDSLKCHQVHAQLPQSKKSRIM